MTEKQFVRTIAGQIYDIKNDKFFEEDYVDKPIGYEDDLVTFLNELSEKNENLEKENEQLKKQLNDITLNWTQNHQQFDKDTLHIKDNNTEINLKDRNLCIEVFAPEINEYFRFRYIVTGRIFERTLEYSEEG